MSLDQINEQIAAARAAAASGASAAAPAPAPAGAGATPPAVGGYAAPVPAVAGGRPVSLGELLAEGGMRVDKYLKVDKLGFLIGDDLKNAQEELLVEFRLSDITPFWGLRWGQQPAKYLKSFDRILESKSKKPWASCVAEAQAADNRCRGDYPTADIAFTMVEGITATKGEKKDTVLIAAGQTLGLTLSITNFKEFAAFIKPYEDMRAAGKLPDDTLLRGKLTHITAEGGGNVYGKARFDDFIVASLGGDEAPVEGDEG